MQAQISENKLIALFIEVDDLAIAFQSYQNNHQVGKTRKPTRTPALTQSEICTILVAYHLSGYKCFEYFYRHQILSQYHSYFPKAPSYSRFVALIERVYPLLYVWSLHTCLKASRNGLYFIDSKRIPVCHIKRENSHKVFAHTARKGKSSLGWFYGFKLHLVINAYGQIVNYSFTTGNVADNNGQLLQRLLKGLEGLCVGDKGYHTRLFDYFYSQGLHLLVKPKKKSIQKAICLLDHQLYLKKRALIESVNDLLISICNLEHTRHRKVENAFISMMASLIAYQSLDHKPSIFVANTQHPYAMAA